MPVLRNLLLPAMLLAIVCSTSACKRKQVHGHSHGEESTGGHGHEQGAPGFKRFLAVKGVEFFMEYPALQIGEVAKFGVHLTDLKDFKPIKTGKVEVALAKGSAEELFSAGVSDVPGIFNVEVSPKAPGPVKLFVIYQGPQGPITLDLGQHEVYQDKQSSAQADFPEVPEGISFTKEQQWQVAFGVMEATKRPLNGGFEAYGTLQAVPGREGRVLATVSGRLEGIFPSVGQSVKKGQKLGTLIPRAGGADMALGSVQMDFDRARLRLEQTQANARRLKPLSEIGAVSKQAMEDAERDVALAESELKVMKARKDEVSSGRGGMGFALTAPVSGIMCAVHGGAGVQVNEGQEIFHIADTRALRLEIQIPESQANLPDKIHSAWFTVPGSEPLLLESGKNCKVIGLGGAVNPHWKTVPLVLEFANPKERWKVGNSGQAFVRTGTPAPKLAIPVSALQDEDGLSVVYIQTFGETFERRLVQVGNRDGDWVQILQGIQEGDRVVHVGAHVVRLAASAGKVPTHGHAH